MKTYGVVLIGCGHIGESHLQDIYFRENIRVIGVVDLDLKRAQEFARRFGAESYDADYSRYLLDDRVDVIIVATYTGSHLEIIRRCAQHGKHVLCEKPLVRGEEEIGELRRILESGRIRILPGHILRHNETYRRTAEIIKSGALGAPLFFRMVQNHHAKDWERYKRLLRDGSPVFDCGVHYFDVMQWFSGEKIVRIAGLGSRLDSDLPEGMLNHGIVTVELSGGSRGYYEAGWSRNLCSENVKEIVGPAGHLRITLAAQRASHVENGDLIEWYRQEQDEYRVINQKCEYKPMWKQFCTLLRMIEDPAYPGDPTPEDYLSALWVACEADRVIRRNG